MHSLRLLLMVVVGGAGFYFGPILGAALVIVLPEFLRVTDEYYLMIYATAVLVLMIFCPTGIIGLFQRAARQMARPAGPRRPAGRSPAVNAPATIPASRS